MSTRLPVRRSLAAVMALIFVLSLTGSGAEATPEIGRPSWAGVDWWMTDLAGTERLARRPRLDWEPGPGAAGATIVVDPARRYQSMTGFGASMTDSSAYVLSTYLKPRERRRIMRELFSPTDGIGLSMLRQPMGASDFAVGRAYSYDDQPTGQTDADLSEFTIRHDRAHILPRLREAYRLNPRLTFMASPWSAPGWMKTTDSMVEGSLLERYHQTYADYFVKFIRAYRRAGIPTDYVTMQNEPLYEPPDYPGMWVPPDQAAIFLAGHLGPTLAREGLHDTTILGYDHNWDVPDYPEAMYADQRVARYVPGTAWHCYGGEIVAQSVSHNNYPHAQAFQTECSGGAWQGDGDPVEAFELTMASVIGEPRNWGQSVMLWNLALNEENGPFIGGCTTCRGVVSVDSDGTVTKELDYWALGHASKFVPPGAVRIGSSLHPSAAEPDRTERGLTNVAFTNRDGSSVLIAHNATGRSTTFDIQVGDRHVTSTLAAGAAATYRWSTPRHVGPADALDSAADLGWVDLDYGAGPAGTPTGRLTASVSPEVVGALSQVKLGEDWLAYALPGGAELRRPGPANTVPRDGWRVSAAGTMSVEGQPPENMLDGDRRTRWSSGEGQRPGMTLTVDLAEARTFTEIVLDAGVDIGDFVRSYTVQTSPDGQSWKDIAVGPGRPSLTGEMVIALPPTTSRHLRLVSGAESLSWWSVHELNLRYVTGTAEPVTAGRELVRAGGSLADGTTVLGYYNSGLDGTDVPWPIPGFPYTYRLPPTAAVTFGLVGSAPAASTSGGRFSDDGQLPARQSARPR